jgi:hypothetical protein
MTTTTSGRGQRRLLFSATGRAGVVPGYFSSADTMLLDLVREQNGRNFVRTKSASV